MAGRASLHTLLSALDAAPPGRWTPGSGANQISATALFRHEPMRLTERRSPSRTPAWAQAAEVYWLPQMLSCLLGMARLASNSTKVGTASVPTLPDLRHSWGDRSESSARE
jgi:hypothetical protein